MHLSLRPLALGKSPKALAICHRPTSATSQPRLPQQQRPSLLAHVAEHTGVDTSHDDAEHRSSGQGQHPLAALDVEALTTRLANTTRLAEVLAEQLEQADQARDEALAALADQEECYLDFEAWEDREAELLHMGQAVRDSKAALERELTVAQIRLQQLEKEFLQSRARATKYSATAAEAQHAQQAQREAEHRLAQQATQIADLEATLAQRSAEAQLLLQELAAAQEAADAKTREAAAAQAAVAAAASKTDSAPGRKQEARREAAVDALQEQVTQLRTAAVEAQVEAASLRETVASLQEQLAQHAARAEQEAQRAQQLERELTQAAAEASRTGASGLEGAHNEAAASEPQPDSALEVTALREELEQVKRELSEAQQKASKLRSKRRSAGQQEVQPVDQEGPEGQGGPSEGPAAGWAELRGSARGQPWLLASFADVPGIAAAPRKALRALSTQLAERLAREAYTQCQQLLGGSTSQEAIFHRSSFWPCVAETLPEGSPERQLCLSEDARSHGLLLRFSSNSKGGAPLAALNARDFGASAAGNESGAAQPSARAKKRVARSINTKHHREWAGYEAVREGLTLGVLEAALGEAALKEGASGLGWDLWEGEHSV